jgi:hypothetical protein
MIPSAVQRETLIEPLVPAGWLVVTEPVHHARLAGYVAGQS